MLGISFLPGARARYSAHAVEACQHNLKGELQSLRRWGTVGRTSPDEDLVLVFCGNTTVKGDPSKPNHQLSALDPQ
jgi:hypothetical protein